MSCNSKIANLIKKLENFKNKSKTQSALIKKLRSDLKRVTEGRDNWKAKNKVKVQTIKNLNAKIDRRDKASRHHYPMDIVELCIKLRIQAGCSYRSICKILVIANICFKLNILRIPCANTIENWVSKMGLFQLKNVHNKLNSNKVCLIVDECCGVGNEKLLKILACPAVKEGNKALCFEDVHVCYMASAKSWNSDKITEAINSVVAKNGFEVKYILSDEASVFKCSARKLGIQHLPDIAHALATCLRKTFEKDIDYKAFTKEVSGYQAKSVNQDLTIYRPPKQRLKARFMNQKPVVKWARIMLNNFDDLTPEAKEFFKDIVKHVSILEELEICMNIVEGINLIFKTKGLSKKTFYKSIEILKLAEGEKSINRYFTYTELDPCESFVATFINLVYNYLSKYNVFIEGSEDSLHVSSDIIESMFGKYKKISSNDPLIGLSLLNLELPVYSVKGDKIRFEAKNALEGLYVSDLSDWREEYSTENQAVKRNSFFKKRA